MLLSSEITGFKKKYQHFGKVGLCIAAYRTECVALDIRRLERNAAILIAEHSIWGPSKPVLDKIDSLKHSLESSSATLEQAKSFLAELIQNFFEPCTDDERLPAIVFSDIAHRFCRKCSQADCKT